ncbi:hypothetical protein [Halostella salina]|uniref:hypothetical protein n=1 Tax=Halostella salina TaxID=1547897 RepID=UPI0013CF2A46|nr:hypothetical protein [Halostella salina]
MTAPELDSLLDTVGFGRINTTRIRVPTAYGATGDGIAIATEADRIHVFHEGGVEQYETEVSTTCDEIALAADHSIYGVFDGSISTITDIGSLEDNWQSDVTELVALSESDLLVALRVDGSMVGLNTVSGSVRFPIDGVELTPNRRQLFDLGSWFACTSQETLRCYDETGVIQFNRSFDSPIVSVAALGDSIVVTTDAAIYWVGRDGLVKTSSDHAGVELAGAGGRTEILGQSEQQLLTVGALPGEHSPLGDDTYEIVQSHDGTLCIALADGEAIRYGVADPTPEITLTDDRISTPQNTLETSYTKPSETAVLFEYEVLTHEDEQLKQSRTSVNGTEGEIVLPLPDSIEQQAGNTVTVALRLAHTDTTVYREPLEVVNEDSEATPQDSKYSNGVEGSTPTHEKPSGSIESDTDATVEPQQLKPTATANQDRVSGSTASEQTKSSEIAENSLVDFAGPSQSQTESSQEAGDAEQTLGVGRSVPFKSDVHSADTANSDLTNPNVDCDLSLVRIDHQETILELDVDNKTDRQINDIALIRKRPGNLRFEDEQVREYSIEELDTDGEVSVTIQVPYRQQRHIDVEVHIDGQAVESVEATIPAIDLDISGAIVQSENGIRAVVRNTLDSPLADDLQLAVGGQQYHLDTKLPPGRTHFVLPFKEKWIQRLLSKGSTKIGLRPNTGNTKAVGEIQASDASTELTVNRRTTTVPGPKRNVTASLSNQEEELLTSHLETAGIEDTTGQMIVEQVTVENEGNLTASDLDLLSDEGCLSDIGPIHPGEQQTWNRIHYLKPGQQTGLQELWIEDGDGSARTDARTLKSRSSDLAVFGQLVEDRPSGKVHVTVWNYTDTEYQIEEIYVDALDESHTPRTQQVAANDRQRFSFSTAVSDADEHPDLMRMAVKFKDNTSASMCLWSVVERTESYPLSVEVDNATLTEQDDSDDLSDVRVELDIRITNTTDQQVELTEFGVNGDDVSSEKSVNRTLNSGEHTTIGPIMETIDRLGHRYELEVTTRYECDDEANKQVRELSAVRRRTDDGTAEFTEWRSKPVVLEPPEHSISDWSA